MGTSNRSIACHIHDLLKYDLTGTPTPDRRVREMDSAIRLREAFRELKIFSCVDVEKFQDALELQMTVDKFIRAHGSDKENAYVQLRCVLTKHDELKLVIDELRLMVDLPDLN